MELYQYILQLTAEYHSYCLAIGLPGKTLPFMEELQAPDEEDTPPFYMDDYYASMRKIISESATVVPSHFVYGFLVKSQEDVGKMLSLSEKLAQSQKNYSHDLLNEDYLDLFDLYCDLFFRARSNGANADDIDAAIPSNMSITPATIRHRSASMKLLSEFENTKWIPANEKIIPMYVNMTV